MGQGLEPEGTGTGPGKPGPGSTREPEGTGTFKNRPVTSLHSACRTAKASGLTNMVGCWNLGLKMIPNDRLRSSLGPLGVFGPKIRIFGGHGGPGPLVHRGILAFFRMWPHTNGWAPNGAQ